MPSSSRTDRRRKSRRDHCDERGGEGTIEVEYQLPQHHQLQRKHSNTQKDSSWLDIDSDLEISSKHKNGDSREENELVERAISQRRDSIREKSRDVDSQKIPITSSSKLSHQSSTNIDMNYRDRNHERRKARREKRSQKQFDSRDSSNSLQYDSSNEIDEKKYRSSDKSKTDRSSDRKLRHANKKEEGSLQKQSNSRDISRQRCDSSSNEYSYEKKLKSDSILESNHNKLNTTKEKPPKQPKYEMKQDKRKKTYSSKKRESKEIDIPMEIECNNAYNEEQNKIIQEVQRKREYDKVEGKRKGKNNKKKEVSDIENQNRQETFDDNPLEENHSKRRCQNDQEFVHTSQGQRNQMPTEHCTKSQRFRKCVWPFMLLILILCIAAWLGRYIPGLRDEVKKLEVQVGRLQEVNSNLE